MQHRLIEPDPQVFVLIFEPGDDPIAVLAEFAKEHAITGASLSGIGAFSQAMLGYFDVTRESYIDIPITEQVEVLSFSGDIAMNGDQPMVHIHTTVGFRDGSMKGGHLQFARVRPTLEVVLTETRATLRRSFDPASGLALIDLDRTTFEDETEIQDASD